VFEHNTRMRALIEKIGGEQEGYHRAQTRQNGKPINMVSYGIFKEGSDE
jgi:RimJ/RimL family protein N-acetyltransferase